MIEVKTNDQKLEIPEFPRLRSSKSNAGLIVLFTSRETGVVITQGSSPWAAGQYSSSWSDSCFTDYNEPITLQNIPS